MNLEYKQEKKIIFKLHLHSIWSFRHPAKPLFMGFSAIFQCHLTNPVSVFLTNSASLRTLSFPCRIDCRERDSLRDLERGCGGEISLKVLILQGFLRYSLTGFVKKDPKDFHP